jgi:hypothetical protein
VASKSDFIPQRANSFLWFRLCLYCSCLTQTAALLQFTKREGRNTNIDSSINSSHKNIVDDADDRTATSCKGKQEKKALDDRVSKHTFYEL